MFRTLALVPAALALAPPALAGDVTLKRGVVGSMATALADADPRGGWIAVEAEPEPLAAKAKADILIESFGFTVPLAVGYDRELLQDAPWGATTDGAYLIYAVDAIAVGARAEYGFFDAMPSRHPAELERPLTWTVVAEAHLGYLLVDTAGAATLVLPVDTALAGIEPDEID
jgi:hypothetical protein